MNTKVSPIYLLNIKSFKLIVFRQVVRAKTQTQTKVLGVKIMEDLIKDPLFLTFLENRKSDSVRLASLPLGHRMPRLNRCCLL